MLSTYFFAAYVITLKRNNAVIFLFMLFLSFSYLLNFKKDIILPDIFDLVNFSWYFLAFTVTPLIIILSFNYVFKKYPYLLYIFEPTDDEEINREDNIIIDIVGFIQAILLINFSFENISIYKYVSVIGLIVFTIPRSYAIIKNSSFWRWVSMSVLLIIMIINGYMLFAESPMPFEIINNINNVVNIPVDVLYILLLVYTITVLLLTVIDVAKYRYLRANDRFFDLHLIIKPRTKSKL